MISKTTPSSKQIAFVPIRFCYPISSSLLEVSVIGWCKLMHACACVENRISRTKPTVS